MTGSVCLLPLRPSQGKDDRRIKSTVDICISFQMLKKIIFYLYEYNFVVSRFLPLHKLLSDYHTNLTSLRCVVCINHVLVYSSSTLRSWFLWASCTLFSLSLAFNNLRLSTRNWTMVLFLTVWHRGLHEIVYHTVPSLPPFLCIIP